MQDKLLKLTCRIGQKGVGLGAKFKTCRGKIRLGLFAGGYGLKYFFSFVLRSLSTRCEYEMNENLICMIDSA